MVPALRKSFNETFTRQRYDDLLADLDSRYPGAIEFRIAETPVFIPKDFAAKLTDVCEYLVDLILEPKFRQLTDRAIPPSDLVPNETVHPHFLAFDFGICEDGHGGYQPQLALSDSGAYYDAYFPTQEEMDAATWLQSVYDRIPPDAQQTMLLQTSQDVFERIQSIYVGPTDGTVDPLMLQPGSYVMLGHAEVDQDRASIDYRGTSVPYVYPTQLLEDLMDKIYVSPGVEIYR